MKIHWILLLALLQTAFVLNCHSPRTYKREFRAVWVATIHNIDWPSQKGLSTAQQQAEFIQLIERHRRMGMNAVIVQVRASGDAFYLSGYEPWSEWLSGTQGQAPQPFYDPLEFMIAETHRRGMEFHAWINPFRGVSHTRFSSVAPDHISRQQPGWFFQFKNTLYFNPGIPAVRQYLCDVVRQIVACYDVDGIHFDDYFYPYRKPGELLADAHTFRKYGKGFTDIEAWRRDNIDQFIHQVADSIRALKPYVKFGVSPIGIWRNKRDDPRGSNSHSFASYDMAYADVRKWLQQGWIDYVAPQLYWSTAHQGANYEELIQWWADNAFGRHVYVGHAMFKVKNEPSGGWKNPLELPRQLHILRSMPRIQGSIFYSANSFEGNPYQVEQLLEEDFYRYPALPPAMPWKDALPPLPPWEVHISYEQELPVIRWRRPIAAADGQRPLRYVVYGFPSGKAVDLSRPEFIRAIQADTLFTDSLGMQQAGYRYAITALDRLHNESEAAIVEARPLKRIATDAFGPPPDLGTVKE